MSSKRLTFFGGDAVVDPELSDLDVRVLALLGRSQDGNGWCFRKQSEMAKDLRKNRQQINAAIATLVRTGWVEKRDVRRPDGGRDMCHYRVRLDPSDVEARAVVRRIKAAVSPEESGEGEGEEFSHSEDPPMNAIDNNPMNPSDNNPLNAIDNNPMNASDNNNNGVFDSKRFNDSPLSPPAGGVSEDRSDFETGVAVTGVDEAFEAFYAGYPEKGDGPVRARREWERLSAAERMVAAGAVERVFQLRRARGMTKHPAVHTYLRNRMWVDAPPAKASGGGAPSRVPLRAFSRDFWIVFVGRVLRGGNWQWLVTEADRPGGQLTVPAEEAPTVAQLDGFVAVVVRGADGRATPEFAAWDRWFHERGVRLPRPQRADRIFMPARTPGEWLAAGGEGGASVDAGVASVDEAGAVFDGR